MSKNTVKRSDTAPAEKQMTRKERKKLERLEHAKKLKEKQGEKVTVPGLGEIATTKAVTKQGEEFKQEFIPIPEKPVKREEYDKLKRDYKKLKDADEVNKDKQKHFIAQTKKLSQERDEAVAAQKSIQEQCEEKVHKSDEIMAQVTLKNLEQEKEIFELREELRNLKEVVFDLMLEKQKVGDEAEEIHVEVPAEIQERLDREKKQPEAETVSKSEFLTLLKFSNDIIKERNEMIKRLQETSLAPTEETVEETS